MEKPASLEASESPDTRESLMNAAKKVFAQHGFEGATVKAIAEAAGVNISLVSYHFHGKEGLFRACFEQVGKQRLASAQRTLQPVSSLEEFRVRLKIYAEDFFLFNLEEPEVSTLLHRECVGEMPLTKDIFRETFLKSFDLLTGFFQDAQQKGILRSDLNPFLTGGLYFGGLIHVARTHHMVQEIYGFSLSDKAYRDQLIEASLQGLLLGILSNSKGTEL